MSLVVISLYSAGVFQVAKIRDVKKLQQDIENDPINKDQMANLGCLLVCTFSNFIGPVLVAAHTVNNLDLGHEQGFDNEGSENDLKDFFSEFLCLVAGCKKFFYRKKTITETISAFLMMQLNSLRIFLKLIWALFESDILSG